MSKDLYKTIISQKPKMQHVSEQYLQELLSYDQQAYLLIEQEKQITLHHKSNLQQQEIYLFVEQDAICVLYNFDTSNIKRHVTYHIVLEQGAQFYMNFAILHAEETRYDISLYLKGNRAQAQINGLYALGQNQQAAVKTYQYHDAPDTKSHVLVKGMLKDQAQAKYQGLIVLDHGSQQAIAGQENKNIVLSKQAKIVSVPSIEVLQHNVQCSHGSAIGKFDKQAAWYLQSKGLSQARLKELLIQTFFDPALDGYDQKETIIEALCKKMI